MIFCNLDKASLKVEYGNNTICLSFKINGIFGMMRLIPRSDATGTIQEKFRRKIFSAARARMGGKKPDTMAVACNVVRGEINNASIKILTNPAEWAVIGLRYESFEFGEI